MLNSIKIQCPAKINLTLKVVGKREDGFHNIDSIMQTISLHDYLTISAEPADKTKIILSGTSDEIPYDESNLVYKAGKLFFEKLTSPHESCKLKVHIEKNIPVAAGLAGGSTDAAGMIYGLNKLFGELFDLKDLHKMCAQLGSDLNVCLEGGKQKTSGRGEILEPLDFEEFEVSLIKPINLGISAKEAYTKFSKKEKDALRNTFQNDLEWAVINNYKQLQYIKEKYPDAVMSGSGSTYFGIGMTFKDEKGFWIKNSLKSIPYGVKEIK